MKMVPASPRGLLSVVLFLSCQLSPHQYCSTHHKESVVDTVCVGSGTSDHYYYSLGQDVIKSFTYGKSFVRHQYGVEDGNNHEIDPTAKIYLYTIQTTRKRFLSGYIVASIRSNRDHHPKGNFNLLYVQMEDENGNAVGEFLQTPPCSSKIGGDVKPEVKFSSFFFTPCAQAGPSDTKVPVAFTFVWHDRINNPEVKSELALLYGNAGIRENIYLYWRLSQTTCHKSKKVRMRAYIQTDATVNGHFGAFRSSWFHLNWFGAADIIHPDEEICTLSQIDNSKPQGPAGPSEAPWIKEVEINVPNAANTPNDVTRKKRFCKPIYMGAGTDRKRRAVLNLDEVPFFAGRCNKENEGGASESVSNTYAHDCAAGANFSEIFGSYTKYLEKRKSCLQINGCPCQCRTFVNSTKTVGVSTCLGTNHVVLGVSTDSPAGKSVLRARKVHGIAMLFVSMVFVPFNILISRYFKETWLDRAQLKNVQIWYLVHILITSLTICIYIFGLVSLRRSKNLLGDSLVGEAHRELGWTTIAFFILATFTGPFRPISSGANQKTRKCVMIIHALLGIVYYYLGMAAIITSSSIPGSPSSSEVACITSPLYKKLSEVTIMPLVVTWIVMDFGFHVIFMLLLRWADNRLDIRRPMYLPLVSILKDGGGHHDMKGFRYRKLILIIYSICNGGIVLELMLRLGNSTKAGCGFGSMTCTHSSVEELLDGNSCGSL